MSTASEGLTEATDWWCSESGEPRQVPCCTACVPSLSALLSEFYNSDDGDYVSALGDIHRHVAAREAAAATRARAEGAGPMSDEERARLGERLHAEGFYAPAVKVRIAVALDELLRDRADSIARSAS